MTTDKTQDLRTEFLPAPAKTRWQGQWVWVDAAAADRNVYAFFRRSFTVGQPTRLKIEITADSFYWLYLDGRWLARGPARSFLDSYGFDQYIESLAPGRHVLAVLVHHVGEINATMMKGRPGLLVDAKLDSGEDLSTGVDGWRCQLATAWRKDLPCLMSHHGFWEDLDQRLLPAQWTSVDFPAAAWSAPVVIGAAGCEPWRQLIPRDIPPMQLRPLQPPVVAAGHWDAETADVMPSKEMASRRRSADWRLRKLPLSIQPTLGGGVYVTVDCGLTISGYVVLRFAGAQGGERVSVSYDELLMPCGAINPERSYQHAADRYRLAAGQSEITTAHPRGFRYVTVDLEALNQKLVLESVAVIEERYPFEYRAQFHSSDPRLEQWFKQGVRTVEGTTIDTYVDCITRERVTWLDGILQQGAVTAMVHGDTEMTRRVLFLGAQGQLPDGRINGFVPSERTNCAFPCYSFYWVHTLLDYWLFTGRNDDLRQLFPVVLRVLGYFERNRDAQGVVKELKDAGQFFDWSPIADTGSLLLINAFLCFTWQRLAETLPAGYLEKDLAVEAKALRAAAHARYWDAERGVYADATDAAGVKIKQWSQQANALAVLSGICPPEMRRALLQRITDPAQVGPVPVGENAHKSVGNDPQRIVPVGTPWWAWWLTRAFHAEGLDEEALQLMSSYWGSFDLLPMYPEMLVQHGNSTLCHSWSGGVTELLLRSVLGIGPAGPGWSRARFAPHPGNLTQISATFPTVRGELSASWERKGDAYEMRLRVPAGVVVEIPWLGAKAEVVGPCEWQGTASPVRTA